MEGYANAINTGLGLYGHHGPGCTEAATEELSLVMGQK